MKYLKRVSSELEAIEGGPEAEELMLQGVRFAFRVHQVRTFLVVKKIESKLKKPCFRPISRVVLNALYVLVASCSLLVGSTWTPCEPSRSSRRRRPCAGCSDRRRAGTCGGSRGSSPGPDDRAFMREDQAVYHSIRHSSLR
jgi:hypothetical protein